MRTVGVLLASAALALAGATQTVQNSRVTASDGTLAPGETATWSGDYPSVIVYFTDGSLDIAGRATKAKRGEAVFESAEKRTVKNTGTAEMHYARIELLGKGLPETWGAAGLAPHYRLLFENQFARLYDIRIPAGTNEPQHTHHDRVVVCLSGAHLKHLMPDGREEPSTLKTGDILWRKGGTHIGQNLGKTDLWVIAVEPK